MKRIKQFLISIFLMGLLTSTTYGLGTGSNNSTTAPTASTGLINSTESDQDITLAQNLIIVDDVQFQSRNELYVRETLIFKNSGTMNFSGSLRTWVPDGAGALNISRSEMMTGANEIPVEWKQNGNIITWPAEIDANAIPPLYTVEYLLPETSGTKQYSKMFIYPTLVTKKPDSIILKITMNTGENAVLKDENGNSISDSGSPIQEGNSITYNWETPQFNEINLAIVSSGTTSSGFAGYVILGVVIILIFSYSVLRKRNEKIRAFEDKIRNPLRRKEETSEESGGEPVEEIKPHEPVENTEFEGKTREELEAIKDETVSRLSELDKEYESGNMMDEEYDELKKSYREKVDKITERLKKPG